MLNSRRTEKLLYFRLSPSQLPHHPREESKNNKNGRKSQMVERSQKNHR